MFYCVLSCSLVFFGGRISHPSFVLLFLSIYLCVVSNKKNNIWGPSPIPNISRACWFVFFIDDCTRVSWIFSLKHQSDVSFVLPSFHKMIKNWFGVTIKRFRSNNAKDYFNQVLISYFHHEGIIHESSCVNTLQQNGVAERKNGYFLDRTRIFLFQKHVPKSY